MTTEVRFIRVADVRAKLAEVTALLQHLYFKRRRCLVKADSEAAAGQIDKLIWENPPESFLPHLKAKHDVDAQIAITWLDHNINDADALLNLAKGASPIAKHFSTVYELWDSSSPQKLQQSQAKYQHYKKLGMPIGGA